MFEAILALDPGRLSLLGVVLSALVASLGYYGKLRHERKKTRRVVLFHLLKIRDATLWEDRAARHLPGDLVSSVEAALRRHELHLSDELKSNLTRTASQSLADFLRDRTRTALTRQIPDLNSALLDLAKDDPLLASRISEGLPEMSINESPIASEPAERTTFAVDLMAALTRSARTTTLDRVTSTLRLTALECGLRSWIDIELKLFLQSRWKPKSSFAESVSEAVDELVKSLVQDEVRKRVHGAPACTPQ